MLPRKFPQNKYGFALPVGLAIIVLSGCFKEPQPVTLESKIPFTSEEAMKNPSALLEGLRFLPAEQPLNKKDLSALNAIILQSHALALAEGERHLKIRKSWAVFRTVDLSLRKEKLWQDFVRNNQAIDDVDAEILSGLISESLR